MSLLSSLALTIFIAVVGVIIAGVIVAVAFNSLIGPTFGLTVVSVGQGAGIFFFVLLIAFMVRIILPTGSTA